MGFRSSLVIIICCLGLQFSNIAQKRYVLSLTPYFGAVVVVCFQGLMFLVYPLLGYLADVYLTRYRTVKFGIISIIIGEAGVILYSIFAAVIDSKFPNIQVSDNAAEALFSAIAAVVVIGIGLFEANAIQFGLDQLLEHPTPKLVAFIHWYYWAHNVGRLLAFYAYYGAYLAVIKTLQILFPTKLSLQKILSAGEVFILILITVAILVLFCISKKYFYVQRAGLNPFKKIYQVLKYAWQHNVPAHRSAFTYWEEDIPPCIDLGKNKYGGPFTTEEVEDTKTFLRILPLLFCLFGYHIAGDGYSAPEQLQRTSCPSLSVLLLLVANPLHISTLVTVVGIPLYRLVIIKIFPSIKSVLMLTKMWIGLYLSLVQVVIYIIVITYAYCDAGYNHDDCHNNFSWNQQCLNIRLENNYSKSCVLAGDTVDSTYLWFIIPQLLKGFSSLLVTMTIFQFICAQAPRITQGLLIGLWYATYSIRYLLVGLLDFYITERRSWLICEGTKGFLILVSLMLFWCVSKRYRYRQRDDIVNVQGMIEEIYEKRIDQEEEYIQERGTFYQNLPECNTI